MIQLWNVTKKFEGEVALDHVSLSVFEGQIYGLLGTNGAGKSTALRLMCGIDTWDSGRILVDGEDVYDNVKAKEKIYFCSEQPFYFPHSTGLEMAHYIRQYYPAFRMDLFLKWMSVFQLDEKRKIGTYSKGKKKQLSILLGLAAQTKYLFCDESFDGLDPAMRQAVKTLLIAEMAERNLTVLIASHNLRELEDFCDSVILMHKGEVLLARSLEEAKENTQKVHCVFKKEEDFCQLKKDLSLQKIKKQDTMYSFVAECSRETLENAMKEMDMAYLQITTLSLEELFIMETEVAGYDIKKILLETL